MSRTASTWVSLAALEDRLAAAVVVTRLRDRLPDGHAVALAHEELSADARAVLAALDVEVRTDRFPSSRPLAPLPGLVELVVTRVTA